MSSGERDTSNHFLITQEAKRRAEEEFRKLAMVATPDWAGPGLHMPWNVFIDHPLPAEWPMRRGTALLWYGVGTAFAPWLSDGEYVTQPALAISLKVDSMSWETIVLERVVRSFGRQGVRPLRANEVELQGRAGEVLEILTSLSRGANVDVDPSLLRAFYAMRFTHLALYRQVEHRHRDFCRWVMADPAPLA